MLELPAVAELKKLFSISEEIKTLEPWHFYKETEIITIKDKDDAEPLFCSILGADNGRFGISVYQGYRDFSGFLKILRAGNDPLPQVIIGNKQCLTVYFCEDDLMNEGDSGIMEYADYQPKLGTFNKIIFRAYEPGIEPWFINSTEALCLTKALTLLYQGLIDANKNNLKATFRKGETIYITNEESTDWQTSIKTLPMFAIDEKVVTVKDELLLAKLKRLPRIATAIELDCSYILANTAPNKSQRFICPQIIAIADHDEATIENHKVLESGENSTMETLAILIDYIKENGKPRLLIIREDNLYNTVKFLCDKIGLTVEERPNLEIIDDFLEMVGDFHQEY